MTVYGDLAGWREYAAARGNTAPNLAENADAQAALQRASDYIRTRYVLPLGLVADNPNLSEAAYIAASYELATSGFWSKTFTPAQAKVLTRVEGISWTVQSDSAMERGYQAQVPTSPAIDALFGGTANTGAYLGVMGA